MRVDGLTPAVGTTSNNGEDVLSKLKPGDTVRAQILENSGSELTLKLSDGSKVSASATSPVDAREGEFVNFEYKGTVDGKPALEVAGRNVQPQVDKAMENIKNTLASLKLPVTELNIELAQALKGQNLPITSDSMSKIIELVSKNIELKPASAAFLTAANMSNDKNSIEKLQSLLAGRLKISNDIGELMKLINDDNTNTATPVKLTVVNSLLEKLTSEITSKLSNQSVNTSTVNKGGILPGANTAGTNIANSVGVSNTSGANTVNPNTGSNATVGTTASTGTSGTNTTNISAANVNTANISTANSNSTDASTTSASATHANEVKLNSTTKSNLNNAVGSSTTNNASNILANDSSNNVTQQISNLLKGGEPLGKADLPLLTTLNSKLEAMLNHGNMTTEEQSAAKLIAKEITSAIFKIKGSEAASEHESSSAKSIKDFETTVNSIKSLFVKIDDNSDEINPVRIYKDLQDALQALKGSIQQLPMSMREAATTIANNLESNVNFINQLNNYSSYVQIPLSIFNQNTTGELFMLKKGSKSRKFDPLNMTVLISLDSNHIGRIDTLLSIDKKNISTNFRLENSEVFDYLKENHRLLYLSLLEKGFRLVDFTYRLMEEPISVVNFEAEAKKQFIKSPNNIDIVI